MSGEIQMRKIPITEARNKFMRLLDETDNDQVFAVTKRNREIMAIMSWELYEGLLETLEVMSDPELMNRLKKGIDDVKAGSVHSLSEAYTRLGL